MRPRGKETRWRRRRRGAIGRWASGGTCGRVRASNRPWRYGAQGRSGV